MIIYYCWQKTSTLIAAVCGTVYLDTGFIHEEPTIYIHAYHKGIANSQHFFTDFLQIVNASSCTIRPRAWERAHAYVHT